ncbi:MAG: NUDIX domain-containing protein [Myxococcota bacterium]
MLNVIPRPTARVLLFDPQDRLLLFHVFGLSMPYLWITPGGGKEAHETLEDAAMRELWEETGQQTAVELGPMVWYREHCWEKRGQVFRSEEHFFVARTCSLSVTIHDQREAADILGWRWWRLNELRQSDQIFAPRRLPDLLGPLLRGTIPDAPIDVGI